MIASTPAERFRQASILREITHDKLGASRERDLRAATEGARCISTGEQQMNYSAAKRSGRAGDEDGCHLRL